MSTITANDGTADATTPILINGWAPSAESGNIIHPLIAPGQIAVTLVGDLPRNGTLELLYADDTEAETARIMLARATSFTLEDPDRPVVNMTFVRDGQITPAMHDELRSVWVFSVGFQEIAP